MLEKIKKTGDSKCETAPVSPKVKNENIEVNLMKHYNVGQYQVNK